MNNLLIIDSDPTPDNIVRYKNRLKTLRRNNHQLYVFLEKRGVQWLNDLIWEQVYHPDVIFYVQVTDAWDYPVTFKSDVIFSGQQTLQQLMASAENIEKMIDR